LPCYLQLAQMRQKKKDYKKPLLKELSSTLATAVF